MPQASFKLKGITIELNYIDLQVSIYPIVNRSRTQIKNNIMTYSYLTYS